MITFMASVNYMRASREDDSKLVLDMSTSELPEVIKTIALLGKTFKVTIGEAEPS